EREQARLRGEGDRSVTDLKGPLAGPRGGSGYVDRGVPMYLSPRRFGWRFVLLVVGALSARRVLTGVIALTMGPDEVTVETAVPGVPSSALGSAYSGQPAPEPPMLHTGLFAMTGGLVIFAVFAVAGVLVQRRFAADEPAPEASPTEPLRV